MTIVRSFLLSLILLPLFASFASAQSSYPGGHGTGIVVACPELPDLEGMSFHVDLGPGRVGPSSTVISFATLDGVLFGAQCDIILLPPDTLVIQCGDVIAQLFVTLDRFPPFWDVLPSTVALSADCSDCLLSSGSSSSY